MTLRRRITATLALLALAVGASAAIASYLDTSSQLHGSIDETLQARAAALVSGGDGDGGKGGGPHGRGDPGPSDGDCPTAGSFAPATAGQLVSAAGVVTACIDGAPVLPYSASDLTMTEQRVSVVAATVDGVRYRVVTRHWPAGGVLQVARSTQETDSVLNRLRLRLAVFVLIATALAAALGWSGRS
jgi:hypothetical protein